MVGLGTVRGIVIGNVDRPATPDEIARMTELVEQALAAGACGASSGLEYTPGAFATREELVALCKPLAARRLPYATHMRNEDDHLLDAVDEAIAVASGAGCPLQISHLKTQGPRNWGKLDDVFARIHRARGGLDIASRKSEDARKPPASAKRGKAAPTRARRGATEGAAAPSAAAPGIDVAFDRYPYIAYQTGLSNLFPVWSRAGSTEEFLHRLDEPATADKIRRETVAKVELIGGWDNVQITGVSNYADAAADGKRLGSFAKTQQLEPYALAVALLQRGKGNVGMLGFAMSEENLERIRALNEIASRRGQSLAQLALAWTLRDERVTSTLIGASSVAQLEQNLSALQRLDFEAEELAEIDRYAQDGAINIWESSSQV